jgi:hypothetical protein
MRQAAAPPRRGLIRRHLAWSLFALMLAVFIAGRSVGPRVPDDQAKQWCVVNVHITKLIGVSLNCDAPEFMRDATHLSALLEPGSPLQTRPGAPFAAWLVALPLRPLAAVVAGVARAERADIDRARIDNALQTFGPAYVAYIVLNVLIVGLSFHIFRRICRLHQPVDEPDAVAVVSVAVATLMIATYPLTNYLLSPHTQVLNTLVPLLTLYWALRANAGALADTRFAITVGAVVGLGTTTYGLFPVTAMAVLLFAGLHALGNWPRNAGLVLLRNATILVMMSALPAVLWYVFVRETTGEFYNNEVVRANSVIWMLTAFHEGSSEFVRQFVLRASFHFRGFISLLPMTAAMSAVTAAFLVAAAVRLGREKMIASPAAGVRSTVGTALVVALMLFGFYVCVGQFQVRHSYAAIPPLVAALGVIATTLAGRLPATWRRSFAGACGAIAMVTLALAVAEGQHVTGQWFD